MIAIARGLILHLILFASGLACAQKSPILTPGPLPSDVTPQVQMSQCGGYTGIYGPMDYRGIHPDDRRVVEAYHLDMEMQIFLSGRVEGTHRAGSGPIAGGFVYTLRAIPNHPAALFIIEQLARKLKSERPQSIEWPMECFYVRAFRLTPDDPMVNAMYGIYLAHRARADEAVHHLDKADLALHGMPATQYQIGLANLLLKRYQKAQVNAMRAAGRGYAATALRDQLVSLGKWDANLKPPNDEAEPAESQAVSAAASSAASPAASAP